MKKILVLPGLTLLLALGVQAQSPTVLPGNLAVFKAGDSTGIWNISKSKVQPCFVQIFDPTTTNQGAPLLSVTLPTNGFDAIWINAHAGSEGGGISRTTDRQFLALEGYTGNILSPTNAKPSSDPTVTRGFGTLDAFGTEHVIYSDLANWFGLPAGVTQNNPTGIASTDGTNFWGTGNVTGTSSEASGTLFYNASVSPTPVEIQNFLQGAGEARIIGGTLYVVANTSKGALANGVWNFVDPLNNNAPVPLPFDPNVPNPVQHLVQTNLFINWGSTFANIFNFDMNPAGTVAYGADATYGIVKFTNSSGIWSQAPYYFSSTNIGTTNQVVANQGCFGICVDFSSPNPIIYATTMENGLVKNAQGNPNQNRLIRIVDNGNPGTNMVAQTLATASTTNENFRGIDFTPDLRPLITSAPTGVDTTNHGSATFTVAADSVVALSYYWLQNGTNLAGQNNPSLTFNNLSTNFNNFTYQCVVSNQYGAVTSAPPALLTVTFVAQPPVITNAVAHLTNFVGNTETFAAIDPNGSDPLTFQWYFGSTALTDDGVKYSGSASPSLSISNLVIADSGNYYLVVTNSAGRASNLVDVLTVQYQLPVINSGDEPQSASTFVGLSTSLTCTPSGGTPPFTYQWYKGAMPLSDINEFTGSDTTTLTINPASQADTDSYAFVVSNGGGSVTSTVAAVTVLVPPAPSYVGYSNQVYVQNFDSLPDPGSNSVNSINNPQFPGNINGVAYSLANPFDFAYPIITGNYVGGLGLSNSMPGWYAAADTVFPGVSGLVRFAAQDGDQSTGCIIDFGLNDSDTVTGTNRALGLLSTSTTGSGTYALKLVNQTSNDLNYIALSFLGEFWRNGSGHRTMSFGYTLDDTAANFTLTAQSISNSTLVSDLAFSFPATSTGTLLDGTDPSNQVSLGTNSMQLVGPWHPGGALWLIWAIDFYGSGSGNGYAIDNLHFRASVNPIVQASAPLKLNGLNYAGGSGLSFSFTNVPGASFTVYSATNLTAPINWQPVGQPTEVLNGSYSTYQFTDPAGAAKSRFYRVTSP